MLFSSILLTVLMLAVTGVVARRRGAAVLIPLAALGLGVGTICAGAMFPANAFLALMLCVIGPVWKWSGRGENDYVKLALGATAAAYAMVVPWVVESQRRYGELRERYPFESMADRVRVPEAFDRSGRDAAADERLARIDVEVREGEDRWRSAELEALHEHQVALFVNSPGFGSARMGLLGRFRLANEVSFPVPRQPGPEIGEAWSPGEFDPLPREAEAEFLEILGKSVVGFGHSAGFGYIKNREAVAGFLPHRFADLPGAPAEYRLERLELVGLLLREDPVAYVSEELPSMEDIGTVPTRPLDEFESMALPTLRQGSDLFSTRTNRGIRMLGAVRNASRCVDCHGGDEGALLGAFSYRLVREVGGEAKPATP